MNSFFYSFSCALMILSSCNTKSNNGSENLWTDGERGILVSGLEASLNDVLSETTPIDDSLWSSKRDSKQWSIAEVIEHLILQDQAYYREIKVVSSLPNMPEYIDRVKGNDEKFLEYASDPVKSKADWDVTPTGRFCTKNDALMEFQKVREQIISLVSTSGTDFRQVFTFRKIPQAVIDRNPDFYKVREVRDLHQLVLNAIAHTKRHNGQLTRIIHRPPILGLIMGC